MANHFEDDGAGEVEDALSALCYEVANKNGLTYEQVENCEDGDCMCANCPFYDTARMLEAAEEVQS